MATEFTTPRRAIGLILPSSNRVVERVAHRMIEGRDDIDLCFARVPYSGHPADGYDMSPFRFAARMLAEARVEGICWNATRGALLGFEPDRKLCADLQDLTGVPVTTTALATLDTLKRHGVTRIALVAQGDRAETDRIAANFAREGIEVAVSHSLAIRENFDAARVSSERLLSALRQMDGPADVQARLIWSTNIEGYSLGTTTGGMALVFDSASIGMQSLLGLLPDHPVLIGS
ncbi:hypothetical protein [Paracoccus aestuariivivens]|uniref:Asp/Glu/hydantoin racemase n=1 Tax=Paracoccus aestuariivivens TaxID=1820333 RepID=A0A6L6JGN9_9RHOB|nr:hypothetical protein [Paracoccus aestuariivivens]MTH79869.1 hypothetical protein [Paracoccus aestuariivivens]